MFRSKDVQRFWSRVTKTDSCWLWSGKPNKVNGYGRIHVNGAGMGAHRFSYVLAHGDIPSGMIVRHSCDTPLCVNPDHLLLGTDWDNVQDQIERGRNAKGERNGFAKLSDQDVWQIRDMYARMGWTQMQLVRHFQVNRSTIYRVINNKTRV